MTNYQSFISIYENCFKKYWNNDALTDYNGNTLKYKDVARKIAKLHFIYEAAGIKKGDKIAIYGKNCSNWGVAFMSIITYGAVAVPVLHEFKAENVHHIINDSEAKALFTCGQNDEKTNIDEMPGIAIVIKTENFELSFSRNESSDHILEISNTAFKEKFPDDFTVNDVKYTHDTPEELAIINYTSGTSGFSKGVMIPYRALTSNIEFACNAIPVKAGAKILSILPMAHMYGLAFEFLYQISQGVQVYFLTQKPSPRIIFEAIKEIKPVLVIAVPLIIEKIIRKKILPKLNAPAIRMALHIPILREMIYKKVRKQMIQAFGGEFYEIIIGGAAFNADIDKFLHRIKFPYTVGYGATECAPIICYSDWKESRIGSCGKAALNMEVKILSDNPEKTAGEIICRGPNVMLGYYKNKVATEQVLDKEGWYHTGDLGVMDKDGFVYIRGRCKNMLLGANGQNIYPEELEDKLNNMPFVAESLVIQKGEKIIALIYPDNETLQKEGIVGEEITSRFEEIRKTVNRQLPKYSQISQIRIQEKEFEKTPKKSIKRYLYQ